MKRSTCLEGVKLAFAKTMVHWPKINPMDMATGPPPKGKEHRHPKQYFAQVMNVAWAIEGLCSKDVMLE